MIRCDQGKLRQVGFYKEHINGDLVKHGVWKLFDSSGEVLTTAKFDIDRMVWIKPKGEKRYTSEEIKIIDNCLWIKKTLHMEGFLF